MELTQLADLEAKLAEADQTIQTQKGRLDQAIAAYEEQFRTAQEARTEEFRKGVEARQESHTKAMGEADEALKKALARAQSEMQAQAAAADAQMADLAEKNKQAERLVRAIARTGMAGGYQREANVQRRGLWGMYAVVVLAGLLAIQLTRDALNKAILAEGGIDLAVWLARVAISLPVVLVLLYGITQANGYQTRERVLRNTQLHFASLEPYLASIEDPALRAAMRTALIPRFFGEAPQDETKLADTLAQNPVLAKMIEQLGEAQRDS